MRVSDSVRCKDFPCEDTRRAGYFIPVTAIDPSRVSILLISEASPGDLSDHYHAGAEALFARTTLLAFQDAGAQVGSISDIQALGVHLTTAVKCGKYGYAVATSTVNRCSTVLEREIALFPNLKALLLMGDVAIKSINAIARRQGEPRVIPAGSTYKIRGGEFSFHGIPSFPSYLQAGPSYGIEKSKQRMIAQDIAHALQVAQVA